MIFATLEDETGIANVIIWRRIFERDRAAAVTARLMRVTGRLQREGIVIHLIADRVEDRSALLASLGEEDEEKGPSLFPSRDFH